jgi:hypothetical protein
MRVSDDRIADGGGAADVATVRAVADDRAATARPMATAARSRTESRRWRNFM